MRVGVCSPMIGIFVVVVGIRCKSTSTASPYLSSQSDGTSAILGRYYR